MIEKLWKALGGMKAGYSLLFITLATTALYTGKADFDGWSTFCTVLYISLFGSNAFITVGTAAFRPRWKEASPENVQGQDQVG
jgi:hypothetical protein